KSLTLKPRRHARTIRIARTTPRSNESLRAPCPKEYPKQLHFLIAPRRLRRWTHRIGFHLVDPPSHLRAQIPGRRQEIPNFPPRFLHSHRLLFRIRTRR